MLLREAVGKRTQIGDDEIGGHSFDSRITSAPSQAANVASKKGRAKTNAACRLDVVQHVVSNIKYVLRIQPFLGKGISR